jgi:hypothetical protein
MANIESDRNTALSFYTNIPSAGQRETFWLKAGVAKLLRTGYNAADSSYLLLFFVNTGQDM